jgi:hypothetical protein
MRQMPCIQMEPESGTSYIYIVGERELPDIPQPEECAHHSPVRLHKALFTGHLIYKSSRSSSWLYTRENVVIDPAGSGHDTSPCRKYCIYTLEEQALTRFAAPSSHQYCKKKGMKNKIKIWGAEEASMPPGYRAVLNGGLRWLLVIHAPRFLQITQAKNKIHGIELGPGLQCRLAHVIMPGIYIIWSMISVVDRKGGERQALINDYRCCTRAI